MELDAAMEMTRVQNPIPLDELASQLEAHHGAFSQKNANAQRAIGLIQEGLNILASLGHQMELRPKDLSATLQYPKALHRVAGGAIESKTVEGSEEEETSKDEGWVEHPDGQTGRRPPAKPAPTHHRKTSP